MKLIKVLKTFKNKKGEEVTAYNYFLEINENVRVCIKPVFDEDKNLLKAFAVKED